MSDDKGVVEMVGPYEGVGPTGREWRCTVHGRWLSAGDGADPNEVPPVCRRSGCAVMADTFVIPRRPDGKPWVSEEEEARMASPDYYRGGEDA